MNIINLNNQVTLRGYLAKPVKLSYYKDGKNEKKAIARFTLACKSSDRDKADFFPITAFGTHSVEALEKYTQTGSQLLVSCMLRNNVYEKAVKGKKEKETVYAGLELICNGFEFLSNPNAKKSED